MVSAAGKTFDLGSEHLDSWLELQAAKGRRLIYCAFGTWLRSEVTLLNEVLAMAARRDDLAVVMGLGGLEPTAAPEPQSENTLLLDSAPQMQLLERADAAILHAGIASLNEALLNRTPLVVISVETNDQNGCAERVRWHRLGHVLDRNTASSRTIEHAVDAGLKDDALRERLDNIAGIIKRYDAENIAASSFERALASVDQKRSFSLSIPQT